MTKSNFVYEKGGAIDVGNHGDHDFVYHEGGPVPDTGESALVYEAGQGLGGLGGLAHRYPFDSGAQDTVGSADLGVNGSVTFDRTGKDGNAADFPGKTSAYLSNSYSYDFPKWSISCWVYHDNLTPVDQVWEFNETTDGPSSETHLEYTSDEGMKLKISDPDWNDDGSLHFSGTWEFWVATYDGSTAKLFKNDAGKRVEQAADSGAISSVAGLAVGRDFENDIQPWNGAVDDLRIYNRALSAGEISSLYKSY